MNESETKSERSTKRSDYLEWPEYFMATAFLAAQRSKDPVTQVGACIVNEDNKIVGVGYNGMPIGCNDDDFPWGKHSEEDKLANKHLYVCHAEMNAILNKNSADVKNCTIFVALFPCNECAKFIIQSRIKHVVYLSDKHEHKISTQASKRMLDAAGITYKQFIPTNNKIEIDFIDIICNGTRNEVETMNERNSKRSDYLEWPEYFMATAFLAAQRSKDPITQVGACIVDDDRKIVGVGYNGMPLGCSDNDFPWSKSHDQNRLENKHLYVCHAEMNAILNKNSVDVKNCTIYVALFPCNECAKFIIQSGIKYVVYLSNKCEDKVSTQASKRMFDAAGIVYKQFTPKHNKIEINFNDINWNDMSQVPITPIKNLSIED